ncbi:hypothetical protein C8P68_101172 [Mucilaginibacter yixingensis]|uniref:Anti-sigma regulatory factor (Ser/Thr protein kinase) n=1 Tax=Mucilaginibacter yixingensis TaxID=1295612 RepID=A0A2T5JES7_9SPHI|nr:hypothetical protein [Mucilaginibacter yixingensis]PTR00942.1 hypothetical protein C8P68_101172 [Mucilaginibacter yixingensis]
MQPSAQHTLIFQHLPDQVHPTWQAASAFVQQHIPGAGRSLIFKIKVIVTELLTNSIKHSGHGPTKLSLAINEGRLIIQKMDAGAAFSASVEEDIKWEWPLTTIPHHPIKLYADMLTGLFVTVTSPHSLHFYSEDYEIGADTATGISEHYGLMMICRACDNFTYHFDAVTRHNIFTAIINL